MEIMTEVNSVGNTGVCKFCGQLVAVDGRVKLDENRDMDYYATRKCECPQALMFRRKEQARELAAEKRREAIADAHALIDAKFGETAAEANKNPYINKMNESLVRLLKDAAVLIYDEMIINFTVTGWDSFKATMKKDGKTGDVIVNRHWGGVI